MSTELTKNLYCIQLRTGVEIWVERERVERLQKILESVNSSKFIMFEDQTINTADIVGIFTAQTMEELIRKRNGEWKCSKKSRWHKKGDECACGELYKYQTYA